MWTEIPAKWQQIVYTCQNKQNKKKKKIGDNGPSALPVCYSLTRVALCGPLMSWKWGNAALDVALQISDLTAIRSKALWNVMGLRLLDSNKSDKLYWRRILDPLLLVKWKYGCPRWGNCDINMRVWLPVVSGGSNRKAEWVFDLFVPPRPTPGCVTTETLTPPLRDLYAEDAISGSAGKMAFVQICNLALNVASQTLLRG